MNGPVEYVVQAIRGGVGFVDCRTASTLEEAQKQERELRNPKHWCGGIVGATRIVSVDNARCVYGGRGGYRERQ